MAPAIAFPAQLVYQRLGDVLDHGEAADHVAVDRGESGGHLALVPGSEHQPAELVGERHEGDAPGPGLDVLLGQVLGQVGERRPEHLEEGSVRGLDGDDSVIDAERLCQLLGVVLGTLGGVARRHGDTVHVFGAEGVDGDDGDQRGVDPA